MKNLKTNSFRRVGPLVLICVAFILNAFVPRPEVYSKRSEAYFILSSNGPAQAMPTITVTQSKIKITHDTSGAGHITITKLISAEAGGNTYTFTPGEYDILPGVYSHLLGDGYSNDVGEVHSYVDYN